VSIRRRITRRTPHTARNVPPLMQHSPIFSRNFRNALLAHLLTPEQFAQLPADGEEVCGARPGDGSGIPAACIFRKGHTCTCRYFV
jgi:hypothetical protein